MKIYDSFSFGQNKMAGLNCLNVSGCVADGLPGKHKVIRKCFNNFDNKCGHFGSKGQDIIIYSNQSTQSPILIIIN